MAQLQPLASKLKGSDVVYWGDNGEWLNAYGRHRDSDALDNANFEALRRIVDTACEHEHDAYVIEHFSHWAVGWIDELLINPDCAKAIEAVQSAIDKLEDYPLVDENLYSEMEYESACESAESALYELGIPVEQRKDAASFVVSWGQDAGGRNDYGYAGVRDYWPSKVAQFYGYLAYRRWLRSQQ